MTILWQVKPSMDIQDLEPGIFTAQSLRWKWVSDLHSYNKVKLETYSDLFMFMADVS